MFRIKPEKSLHIMWVLPPSWESQALAWLFSFLLFNTTSKKKTAKLELGHPSKKKQHKESIPWESQAPAWLILFLQGITIGCFFIVTEASCFVGVSHPKLEASGTLKYSQAGAWPFQQELRHSQQKEEPTFGPSAPWESQAPAWLILFLVRITSGCVFHCNRSILLCWGFSPEAGSFGYIKIQPSWSLAFPARASQTQAKTLP